VSAEENRALIERMLKPLSEGDSGPFVAGLAEDVVWIVTGRNPWNGSYRGKAALRKELFAPVMAQLKQPYRLTIVSILADAERVVVELCGVGNATLEGVPYEQNYCWVCRMEQGKLKEVREYDDTYMASKVLNLDALGRAT
jgi:ketosteroid isomerase-like protein